MYKIMLVEDEPAVLNAMTTTIDWGQLSFHPPIACAHGQAAIDAIEGGFIPDAVITDICMPFVDGVALTEYLYEHCPQTLVVMLTGYDDFSYAQKGIKLKVYDYVLKPITPKGLHQLAARLRDELEDRRIRNADEFDTLTRQRFFINLLTARLDPKTVRDNFRAHKIKEDGNWWMAVAVDIGASLTADATVEQSWDEELARYGMGNIVTELTQTFACCRACVPVKNIYCLVLNGPSPESLRESARTLAQQIAQSCTMIGQKTTCGVGKAAAAPQALYDSYLQALLALHYRFFFGHVPCILSDDIDVQPSAEFDFSRYEAQFTDAVKQLNKEKALAAVDALLEQMQLKKLPYTLCLRYCQRIVLHLLERMGEYLAPEEMQRLEHIWDSANFYANATLPQLHVMLHDLCRRSFDSFSRVTEDDSTARVRKVEAYIREHYSNPSLSLNTIRDEFAISVSYFSATFKAGTGYTFVEYLTDVRIEKAKELLTLTEKRTSSVALEVGFSDPHYFSILFKRLTGLTPREYRVQQRADTPQ